MKVSRLIKELQKYSPDANVVLNDRHGDPLLFAIATKDDEKIVWLESEGDCDLGNELAARFEDFVTKQLNPTEFYSDLLEIGIDSETVRKYLGDVCADHMKDHCKKEGLV